MAGSQADDTDWENMTNKELHDKFQQMMSGQVGDVLNRFEEAMEKIDAMEKSFETKLDNKFNELLTRLPPTTTGCTYRTSATTTTMPLSKSVWTSEVCSY